MKLLPICALFLMSLVVNGYCESLQCYQCDDCKVLDDGILQSCPADTTTSSSSIVSSTSESTTEETTPAEPSEEPEEDDLEETVEMIEEVPPDSSSDPEAYKLQPAYNRSALELNHKLIRRSAEDTYSYHCYTIQIKVDDKLKTEKGCAKVPENETACDALKDREGVVQDSCRFCSENRCNSSGMLTYSLVIFVIVRLLALFN